MPNHILLGVGPKAYHVEIFFDECLSPRVTLEVAQEFACYVVHPRNQGGKGDPDHRVVD